MTRNQVGWVLVEGQDADGATLEHDEFAVRRSCPVGAVETAEQAAAAVLQTRAMLDARGQRLHAVGVTWSHAAAADAALLVEFLTKAGLDNVVPVRFRGAAKALTRGTGPRTAVCLIEGDGATVILVSGTEGARTAATRTVDDDGLIRWLTTVFERDNWQPRGLVVAGPASTLDGVVRRLEQALGIPVFAHDDTHLALARGAASASTPSAAFAGVQTDAAAAEPIAEPSRSRPLGYASAVTMLVAGTVTFVVTLALAVGLRLVPDNGPGPVTQVPNTSAAEAAAPPR